MMDYKQKLNSLGITAIQSGKYLCPKCSQNRANKTDKCLSVSFTTSNVVYKCHNCGFTGAVYYSNNEYFERPKIGYFKPSEPAAAVDRSKLYNYGLKRGITAKIIDKYKLDVNDKNEIIFKYYRDNELVNIKYRTNLGDGKKTFRQEKDTEKIFYGMDEVSEIADEIVIVEGEWDVLAFAEIGVAAVSVPQGASEIKLECIENCWEFLQRFESYVICTDNDISGEKLKQNLIQRLGKSKCKIVNWDVGDELKSKDANELLLKDKDALLHLVKSAEFLQIEGIMTIGADRESIFNFWEKGYEDGMSTGWHNIDEIFKIKTGKLMIISGIPSRGKSFFADNLLFNLTKKYNLRHLICSFEIDKNSHIARLASMFLEKDFKNKYNQKSQMTKEELKDAIDYLNAYFYRFEVDRAWSVDEIIEQAEIAVKRYGIKTLTIDPYNRLNNQFTEREDLYVGKILTELTLFAKRNNVFVIFIAHPQKLKKDQKIPTLYDISGSANWYNMADYGIIIHRDRGSDEKLENKSQIIISKVKDFELGDPSGGRVELYFDFNKHKLLEM
jgi:twinkle protein